MLLEYPMRARVAVVKLIQPVCLMAYCLLVFGVSGPLPAVAADEQVKHKVVYQVSDLDKVGFALANLRNHINGVGGPENVELVLVVNGPGLKGFHDAAASDNIKRAAAALQRDGVQFNACGNTMRFQNIETDELIPGFIKVDEGGVVKIAELQAAGYLYIRP